jgi:hypothetical protein
MAAPQQVSQARLMTSLVELPVGRPAIADHHPGVVVAEQRPDDLGAALRSIA